MRIIDRFKKKLKCADCGVLCCDTALRCKSCSNRRKKIGLKWSKEHTERFKQTFQKKREAGIGNGSNPPSYVAVHLWLKKMFGSASICEHCHTDTAYRYEWALLKGKSYEKNRENFIQLCVKCHRNYDETNAHQIVKRMGIKVNLPKGSSNKMSKVRESDINRIFDMYRNLKSQRKVASFFGLAQSTTGEILKRKSWRHVDLSEENAAFAKKYSTLSIEMERGL